MRHAAEFARPSATVRGACGALAALLLCCGLAHAQPGRILSLSRRATASVFLPAPRELRQELSKAIADLREERYVDAIARLETILNSDDPRSPEFGEDYFLPRDDASAPLRSLKSEALRLIGELPPAGREVYELQNGAEARTLLEQAIKARDADLLSRLSRRFFHTDAGHDATLLLGLDDLDRGRPLAAVLHLRRLLNSDLATRRYGVEPRLLLATALVLSGRDDEASDVLQTLRKEAPDAKIAVGGESVQLFAADADPLAWLIDQTGSLVQAPRKLAGDWKLFGGDERRSAVVDVDLPLNRMRWPVPIANDPQDEAALDRFAKEQAGVAATPSMHPLVVNDTVLMRTVDGLLAVELSTGLRIWYPPFEDGADFGEGPFAGLAADAGQRGQLLQRRVWEDSLFGQLSSDGEAVYLLDHLRGDYSGSGPAVSNRMVALDLASEGKLLWWVGNDDGIDEPKLAGAFFLGPPLPVGVELLAIAEVNGEIRLVSLDKSSGRLSWSQQLAHVDAVGSAAASVTSAQRRAAGANPAYADGILVCPTGVGGVVAVDAVNRAFLWGHEYNPRTLRGPTRQRRSLDRWRDTAVTIAQGRVILTPFEADELTCLDLLTGEVVWKQPRGEGIFVGGVHDDDVIVVGKASVSAVGLDTGEVRWNLPLAGSPSGRGLHSGDDYFLATTTPELLQIDLRTGDVAASRTTSEPLGNLVAYKDELLAQNDKTLTSYYQTAKLRRRVEQRLAANPSDAWALEHDGLLLLEEGRQRDGLAQLRASVSAYATTEEGAAEAATTILVDTMLAMLRDDEPDAARLAAEVEALTQDRPERAEFLRWQGRHLQTSGRFVDAFRTYVRLLNLESDVTLGVGALEDELLAVERRRRVRRDRWHRAAFRGLWEQATPDARRQLAALIRDELQRDDSVRWSLLLEAFADLPPARGAVLEELSALVRVEPLSPITEGKLLRLSRSDEETTAARALAVLAGGYTRAGRYEAAAEHYRQLRETYGDVSVGRDQTGAQLAAAEIADNEGLKRLIAYGVEWPFGKVDAAPGVSEPPLNLLAFRRGQFGRRSSFQRVVVEQPPGWSPSGIQLVHNPAGELQGRDSLGQVAFQAMLPASRVRNLTLRCYGHLLVASYADSLMALDALSTSVALDDKVLWQESIPSSNVMTRRGVSTRVRFPFGLSRTVTSTSSGRNPVALGPVTDLGVVLRRWGELTCLDAASGKPIWTRNDVELDAEVWGDEDHVFVHTAQQPLARVFSTLDGSELERRSVPDARRRIRCLGRYVLNYREDPEGVRLQVNDVLAAPIVWAKTFSETAKAAFVGDYELAVFDPERGLRIFSILTGELLVDQPAGSGLRKVDQIEVEKRGGQYIVTLGQFSDGQGSQVHVRSPDASKLLEAEVYAYDARTGEPRWEVPARIDRYVAAELFSPELPILVFLRREEQSPKARLTTLVLDARDGQAIFEHSGELTPAPPCQVQGDRETRQIQLRLAAADGLWNLRMTAAPRPPRPPYGHATAIERNNIGPLGFLNSMIKAISKPLQRIEIESDLFE